MKFKKTTNKSTKSMNDAKSCCDDNGKINDSTDKCKDCPAKDTCDRVKNSVVLEKIHDKSLMIKAVWNINALGPIFKSIDDMSSVNHEMLIDKSEHLWLFSSNTMPTDRQLLDSVFTNQIALDKAHEKVESSCRSVTIDIAIVIADIASVVINWVNHSLYSTNTFITIAFTLGMLLLTRSECKTYKLNSQI